MSVLQRLRWRWYLFRNRGYYATSQYYGYGYATGRVNKKKLLFLLFLLALLIVSPHMNWPPALMRYSVWVAGILQGMPLKYAELYVHHIYFESKYKQYEPVYEVPLLKFSFGPTKISGLAATSPDIGIGQLNPRYHVLTDSHNPASPESPLKRFCAHQFMWCNLYRSSLKFSQGERGANLKFTDDVPESDRQLLRDYYWVCQYVGLHPAIRDLSVPVNSNGLKATISDSRMANTVNSWKADKPYMMTIIYSFYTLLFVAIMVFICVWNPGHIFKRLAVLLGRWLRR